MKRMSLIRVLILIGTILPLLSGTTPSKAEIINGGFETGDLTGWNSGHSFWGSASPQVMTGGAPEGQYFSYLEAMAGSPSDGLCYSNIEKTISVSAGSVLSFEWDAYVSAFGYEEEGVSWDARTTVFVMLYELDEWSPIHEISLSADGFAGSGGQSYSTNGWVTHEWLIDTAGEYTFRVRTESEITGYGNPTEPISPNSMAYIKFDNLQSIPEPATLLLLGFGGLVVIKKR